MAVLAAVVVVVVVVVVVAGLTRPEAVWTVVLGRDTDVDVLEAPATDIIARRGGGPPFPASVTATVTATASRAIVAPTARILRRRCI
jgi:hypothetical protein